jgi:hypothetical protein
MELHETLPARSDDRGRRAPAASSAGRAFPCDEAAMEAAGS